MFSGYSDFKYNHSHFTTLKYLLTIYFHFYTLRGLLEKYPTFGREKGTGLLGALDT